MEYNTSVHVLCPLLVHADSGGLVRHWHPLSRCLGSVAHPLHSPPLFFAASLPLSLPLVSSPLHAPPILSTSLPASSTSRFPLSPPTRACVAFPPPPATQLRLPPSPSHLCRGGRPVRTGSAAGPEIPVMAFQLSASHRVFFVVTMAQVRYNSVQCFLYCHIVSNTF